MFTAVGLYSQRWGFKGIDEYQPMCRAGQNDHETLTRESCTDIGKGLCSEFRHLGGVDGLSVGHVLTDVWHPFDRCLAQFSTVW